MKPPITSYCVNRINAVYHSMPKTEKTIADYITANIHRQKLGTCADLAKMTGTSPATVIRFCRRIGFSGFSELKLSFNQNWLNPESETVPIAKGDSTAAIKQKVLIFNKEAIDGVTHTLSDQALDRAVSLICKAERVLILGDGGSGTSARNAFDVFLQLGIKCEYVTDPFFQIMVIEQMGKRDLILAISNSGRSANTIDNLKLAVKRNIPTIGIVGLPNLPISKYLSVELCTNVFESSDFSDSVAAQICELSAVSVLHSLIIARSGKRNILVGRELTQAYDSKRTRS